MKKRCLIINCHGMKFNGGIEQYFYDLVKILIEDDNVRIVWLLDKRRAICDSFKDLFVNKRLQIVDVKSTGLYWFKYDFFDLRVYEDNVILSFTPVNMAMALSIAEKNKDCDIKCFYCLPNTTGDAYFIENFFYGCAYKYVKREMSLIHKKWVNNDAIRYFSYNHIGALANNYSLSIVPDTIKCLPAVTKMPLFPLDTILNKLTSENFNIISVSRFDFPHKGYLLGLIRSFGKLWETHKNIKLYIIGHGQHKEQVLSEINKLSNGAKANVILLGQVGKNDIGRYMAQAHLNIGVAGGVGCGAIYGVPSIPARNFCYEGCEVYGLLPQSYMKTTSIEPGEDVIPYIDYFISLGKDDYIKECYNSYNAYLGRYSNYNPYYFFEQNSTIADCDNKHDIRFIKWFSILYRFINKIKNIL